MAKDIDRQTQEYARKQAQLVAKAWLDPEFKERLVASPAETLKEQGIEVPEGIEVRVLEHAANVRYFHLPAKPPALEEDLSDEQLTLVQAGMIHFTCSSNQCCDYSHWV